MSECVARCGVVCEIIGGQQNNEQKREMIAKNLCPIMIILHNPLPLVANYLNQTPQLCTGYNLKFGTTILEEMKSFGNI